MAPTSDFYEGVTAALIRKDGKPHWKPASLAEVTPEMVEAFFKPLTDVPELQLEEAKAETAREVFLASAPAAGKEEPRVRRSRL